MQEKLFNIPKISCGHCVMAVKNELVEMEGVSSVEGDPGKKEIVVKWSEPATEEGIRAALDEINYPAQ